MAGIKRIQNRIKSAKNIAQITQAMQMVAASRMRKAQEAAEMGKPYQQKIVEAVFSFSKGIDRSIHPLLKEGDQSGKTFIIIISTNKGLCGGLNTSMFRKISQWFSGYTNLEFLTLGRKAQQYVVRTKGNLEADFTNDNYLMNVQPLTELFISKFLDGTCKEVYIVFNQFINSMKQEPVRRRILPITLETEGANPESEPDNSSTEFIIEPDPKQVLNSLLPHYVEIQVRSAVLEAYASEHSARMVAMKNATDNAKDLIDEFTLLYNRLRQEKITYEIADIVTAKVSME